MFPLADSGEVTQPSPTDAPWPTLATGQAMPVMSVSIPAFVLGMHVIQGVWGTFQLPTFIQTLSKDRPNGQGDRLFTLPPSVFNIDDIKRFTPRKRHLKPKKLLKRLGKDYDSFWMSADLPDDLLETHIKQKLDTSLQEQLKTVNLTTLEYALQTKYGSENGSGDVAGDESGGGGGSSSDVTSSILNLVKSWLVQKASCPVYYRWEDLGLLYWPRWVRRGMCSLKDTPLSKLSSESASKIPKFSSCSWPPGMHCVPAKPKRLKILRWQCRHNKALNNFNRFRLPGTITPRSLLSPSNNDIMKPQPTINSQHLIEHLREGLNFTLHHVEELKRMLNAEKKQTRAKRNTWKSSRQDEVSGKKQGDVKREKHGEADVKKHNDNNDKKHGEADVKKHNDNNDKKQSEADGNDTENWNSMSWKQRQKSLDLTCKWIKIPYPVTDNCFCSC